MQKTTVTFLALSTLIGACSTASKDITAAYVSPMQYQGHDCDQLAVEAQRLQGKIGQLTGRLDEAAANDKSIMGVGMILFWPALFALGGTKGQEAEYARLKGEHDAIQQAAVARKCSVLMAPAAKPVTTSPVAPTSTGKPPQEAAASPELAPATPPAPAAGL